MWKNIVNYINKKNTLLNNNTKLSFLNGNDSSGDIINI